MAVRLRLLAKKLHVFLFGRETPTLLVAAGQLSMHYERLAKLGVAEVNGIGGGGTRGRDPSPTARASQLYARAFGTSQSESRECSVGTNTALATVVHKK